MAIEVLRNLPRPRNFKSIEDAQRYSEDLLSALERWQVEVPETYHHLLSVTHDDTVTATPVKGDVIYANATPAWAKLSAGEEGQVMEMGAEIPNWGRKITISSDTPSGGSNGDIWLKY
jgi:hypothetical protein